MKIGNVTLQYGLILAPMAGVTDATFRRICRACGAEYTVTEMISAKALTFEQLGKNREALKTASLARLSEREIPASVQIFGSEPETMARAAAMISRGEYRGFAGVLPQAIDINMGCPVHKVTGNGEGSALLKNPALVYEIVSRAVEASALPVTVKIRSGWDKKSVNAPEIASIAEKAGASAVCVHARTREMQYAPGADWTVIKAVKESVSIPVIGNGDIFSAEDALRMKEETGCDGVMVARGALGNPWIFEDIKALYEGREPSEHPAGEKVALALSHLESAIAEKGARVGLAEAKKHVAWYIKGVRGAAQIRHEIMNADDAARVEALLRQIGEE